MHHEVKMIAVQESVAAAPKGDIRACNFGMLSSIYQSDQPVEDLRLYCGNYLRQEIQAEGLSSDTGIPSNTIREYFSILEDTLIGSMLRPFKKAVRRKAISRAKFIFLMCA